MVPTRYAPGARVRGQGRPKPLRLVVRRIGGPRRVRKAVAKLEAGLRPNVKSVGKGVHEAKIDFGPGYRAYFAFDGTELILLLGGGEKHGQDDDIAAAQKRWADYKQRKRPQPVRRTSWL